MTQPGHFDLYSNNNKAEVCQLATHTWDDMKAQAAGHGGTPPDVCAVLTSHIYQSYSWHLQDLSDGIIGALTEKMTEKLKKASADYQEQKSEQNTKLFLKQQKAKNVISDGQKLVNEI